MSTPDTTAPTTTAPAATGAAPAAPTTPAAPGGKRSKGSKPRKTANDFVLVAEEKMADGKRRWTEVAPPEGFDPKSKAGRVRKNVKSAVKSALESGKGPAVQMYGGKRLAVIAVGEGFLFNAKVEEVKATKVIVSEG